MADDDGQGQQETVAQIEARIGTASEAELAALADDDRVGVRRAVEAEHTRRASGTETPEQAEITRRAQANTGRPPAEEVSRQIWEERYGGTDAGTEDEALPRVNDDPELLAAGADPVALAEAAARADAEGGRG